MIDEFRDQLSLLELGVTSRNAGVLRVELQRGRGHLPLRPRSVVRHAKTPPSRSTLIRSGLSLSRNAASWYRAKFLASGAIKMATWPGPTSALYQRARYLGACGWSCDSGLTRPSGRLTSQDVLSSAALFSPALLP